MDFRRSMFDESRAVWNTALQEGLFNNLYRTTLLFDDHCDNAEVVKKLSNTLGAEFMEDGV